MYCFLDPSTYAWLGLKKFTSLLDWFFFFFILYNVMCSFIWKVINDLIFS